jgi:hypothetical protein
VCNNSYTHYKCKQLGHGDTTDAWLPLEVTLHCKYLKLSTSTRSSSISSTTSIVSAASSSTLVTSAGDDTTAGSSSSKQQHNVSSVHRTSDVAHRQHLRQHCAAAVSCGMHHTIVSNSNTGSKSLHKYTLYVAHRLVAVFVPYCHCIVYDV